MAERMQNMTPEQREQLMARMRARGGENGGNSGGRGGQTSSAPARPAASRGNATTIDALFGPLPKVESRGQVWIWADKQLKPARLRLGITDGQMTELLDGEVEAGAELATNVNTGTESVRPGFSGFPPFMGPGGRGGPPGGPGGGNRGGGPGGGPGGGGNRGGGGR